MRDHSNHIEVTRDQAIDLLLAACSFDIRTEMVPVSESIGRVLAEDAVSLIDVPNCLTCRMDSVAVHWSDFEDGIPDTRDWEKGRDWEFANTGVAMPEGFDTAVVVEHVIFSAQDTKVAFDAAPSAKYAGTMAPGSKLKCGDLLVSAGTVITPLLASHIASGNNTHVRVIKKPRVAFIPSGNELTPATGADGQDQSLAGRVIETNSIMIGAKIRQWGGEPIIFEIIKDEPAVIERTLKEAASAADIIVLNAGTSKGNDDWSVEVLDRIGQMLYHQTNHGPGHHSWGAVCDGVPVVGLSGPPRSAAFTCDFYLRPVIMKYLGLAETAPKLCVRLGESLPTKKVITDRSKFPGETHPQRTDEFYSVRLLRLGIADDGILTAWPIKGERGLDGPDGQHAACYLMMRTGPGIEAPQKGDRITVDLRPEYLPYLA